jgi:hypothetical protein
MSVKGGVRIKLILIIYQVCIKTMSAKRGIYAYEAYEANKIIFFFAVLTWDRHLFVHIITTYYTEISRRGLTLSRASIALFSPSRAASKPVASIPDQSREVS